MLFNAHTYAENRYEQNEILIVFSVFIVTTMLSAH